MHPRELTPSSPWQEAVSLMRMGLLGRMADGSRAEAAGLRWEDVDLEGRSLTLIGKGGKRRTCFFSDDTHRVLANLPRTVPVLGLKPSGLRQLLRRLSERAGVDISSHQLRRWSATHAWRNGMDLQVSRNCWAMPASSRPGNTSGPT